MNSKRGTEMVSMSRSPTGFYLHHLYILIRSVWGPEFWNILVSTYYCQFFKNIFVFNYKWHGISLWLQFAISLVRNDVENLFLCILVICTSSLVIFQILCLFLIGVICSFLLHFKGFLYTLETRPLFNIWLANIFSHFVHCLFTPLNNVITAKKV